MYSTFTRLITLMLKLNAHTFSKNEDFNGLIKKICIRYTEYKNDKGLSSDAYVKMYRSR